MTFNTPTTTVCLLVCSDDACTVTTYGPILRGLSDGRSISIFSEQRTHALLLTDDVGLRLDLCDSQVWKCSRSIRYPSDVTGSRIIGTSLTKTVNGTLAFAYVEAYARGRNRIVYRPNYQSSEMIVIDSWQSTLELPNSPIFLRFDTKGRAIIGYQRFEQNSLNLVIKRSVSANVFAQVASWPLEKRVSDFSHTPAQTASDRVYVALSSDTIQTLVFDSFSLDESSARLPSPSIDSLARHSELQSSDVSDWSNTALIPLTGAGLSDGLYGFQVSVDLRPEIGPWFAISYYRPNGLRGVQLVQCGLDGCSGFVQSTNYQEFHLLPFYEVNSSITWHLPAVSILAYGRADWRVTVIPPDGTSMAFGSNSRSLYSVSTQVPAYYEPWDSPSLTSGSTSWFKVVLPIVVGIIVLIIIPTLAYHHRAVVCRRNQGDEEPDGDNESKNQRKTLDSYWASLREAGEP